MVNKYIFIVFLFLGINFLFPQQMPLDFSEGADTFIPFANSGFSFNTDPNNSSNAVGQFFNDGSEAWQGFYIDLPQALDLSIQQVITLSFYQFDPNAHTIMVKLEQGSNADVEVVKNTSGTGWATDITFDFSNAIVSDVGTSINATGTYNRLVLFIDGGTLTAGTYLIDDINDGSRSTDPNELDVIYTDLVWSDEFDYIGPIDSSKWYHQTQIPIGDSWFNGEQQHYTNRTANAYVYNGNLNIVAKKEAFTDQGVTKQYTSARLNSKFAFTYGRVDVRAKLPEGAGTWPAIWTLGKNINENGAYWETEGFGTTGWPVCGEIDIMEHGLGATNHVSSALHTSCAGCSGATMNYQSYILSDVSNTYHVYSMNWSPNQITFLIDGVAFYTYNPSVKDITTWPFFEDQYLLLNVAMGGIAGTIDSDFVQSNMVVDYVRVYQNGLGVETQFANAFTMYPNPAKNVIMINTTYAIDKVVVYNTIGQQVLAVEHTKHINIESLKEGFYLVKIYSGNTSISKKIIKR